MFSVFMQGFSCGVITATLIHFWIVPYFMKRKEAKKEMMEIHKSLFDKSVKEIYKGIAEEWLHNDTLTPDIIQGICDLAMFKYSADITMVHEGDDYLIWVKCGINSRQIGGSFTKPPKELEKFKQEQFGNSPIL